MQCYDCCYLKFSFASPPVVRIVVRGGGREFLTFPFLSYASKTKHDVEFNDKQFSHSSASPTRCRVCWFTLFFDMEEHGASQCWKEKLMRFDFSNFQEIVDRTRIALGKIFAEIMEFSKKVFSFKRQQLFAHFAKENNLQMMFKIWFISTWKLDPRRGVFFSSNAPSKDLLLLKRRRENWDFDFLRNW